MPYFSKRKEHLAFQTRRHAQDREENLGELLMFFDAQTARIRRAFRVGGEHAGPLPERDLDRRTVLRTSVVTRRG